eukprot:643903-Alexandrium_andersonii.AAC.1
MTLSLSDDPGAPVDEPSMGRGELDTPPPKELPPQPAPVGVRPKMPPTVAQMQEYEARRAMELSLIHISEPTRLALI